MKPSSGPGRLPDVGDHFGRYQIVRLLGRGGMGVVFEAIDPTLSRSVALKVLNPELSHDDKFRERFHREATVLGSLDSPHIVAIHDVGEHDGCLFLTTQLIGDGDLHQNLLERGPLPPEQAVMLAQQLCEALTDAHAAGVIHRDVKTRNVLLRLTPAGPTAYLCDFGIATGAGTDTGMTQHSQVIGSPGYMAPERHLGAPADARSDLYSLGCLLYAMLTGAEPFTGTSSEVAAAHLHLPPPLLPGNDPLTQAFNSVLQRLLVKDPELRFQSASEVHGALAALGSGDYPRARQLAGQAGLRSNSGTSHQPRLHNRAAARPRRRRALAAGLVVALACLAAIAGGLGWWETRDVAPALEPLSVSATGAVTCVIESGVARCAGANADGQLANGTKEPATTPVQLPGREWSKVVMTSGHACGLHDDGRLACWGWNKYSQLGDGTTSDSLEPVEVPGDDWTDVAVALGYTCAIRADTTAACWGRLPQHTDPDTLDITPVTEPEELEGEGWTALALTDSVGCGHRSDQTIHCWGYGPEGQKGDGVTRDHLDPSADEMGMTQVLGEGWASVSGENYTFCGVRTDHTAACWGGEGPDRGLLGNGTTTPSAVPVDLPYDDWRQIGVGTFHACGVRLNGIIMCWGDNSSGQLGDSSTTSHLVPTQAAGDHWRSLSVGSTHTCATREDGSSWCWGSNSFGSLGQGDDVLDARVPVRVDAGGFIADASRDTVKLAIAAPKPAEVYPTTDPLPAGPDLEAEGTRLCHTDPEGVVVCAGTNNGGQIKPDVGPDARGPIEIPESGSVALARLGATSGCSVNRFGAAYCWGRNNQGQLGNGKRTDEIVSWATLLDQRNWVTIDVGINSACGVHTDSTLTCWGANRAGQLGDGTFEGRAQPVFVPGKDWRRVSIEGKHVCAKKNDDSLWCWGSNEDGAVGNGSPANQPVPVQLPGSWRSVSTGFDHTCAVRNDGTAACWGSNLFGQVWLDATGEDSGNGLDSDVVSRPHDLPGNDWVYVDAGKWHTCGVKADHTAFCWGFNGYGQLANGDTEPMRKLTPLPGSDWDVAMAGDGFSCGAKTDGSVWCWGSNLDRQFGMARPLRPLKPVRLDWIN